MTYRTVDLMGQLVVRPRQGWLLAAIALAVPVLSAARADQGPLKGYDNLPQVEQINQQIRHVWQEYQIEPSPRATDGEWCRRVFLDIIGRIPTVAEVSAYLEDDDADKQRKLVQTILYKPKYQQEYARNWTTIWTNILIGRTGGTERRTLTNRAGMQQYLRDCFASNKPYDQMVYELITATGTSKPGTKGFNGAVNFLAMKVNDQKATLATSATSRIFLGLQIQCTQCHNHPFNEWKQQKFWEFNAFFRQTRALRRFVPGERDIDYIELVDEDFGGEGGGNPEEAEVFYELRNGLLQVAYPVFVDGTAIGRSGFVSDVNRRRELGKLVIRSPYLEKTIVNRMWAHFFGYGFTKPVDDLGPHNVPSHPELLDYLAQQLRQSRFDLKQLIQWITLSEPYALSSRMTDANAMDDPALGESPKFSHFYLRQMQAEQLYESLLVATEAHKTRGDFEQQERAKAQWLKQFVTAFGTDEGDEATTFNGTIPQVLMMFNGDLMKRATSGQRGSFLERIARSPTSPQQKIEYLFLAALARKPTRAEVAVANKLLRARRGDTTAALQDIWWVVLNSNEFLFNH